MSDKRPGLLKTNYMFVPRPLESVQIDKQTVKLYLVVDSTMKPPECTHPFQINKTALAAPGIDRRAMHDVLGAQLNLSAIVDGVLGDWTCHFCCNWCNFANLSILSFHDNAGNEVNSTTTANDSAVLLPVIDGTLAGCRKQVCFVRVQLDLDFSSLVSQGVQGVTVLRVEYYIELPQGSRDLQNGNNQGYRLTTFLGADDIRTIAAADFARDILGTTLQDGPINLLCPDFNLTPARMDSSAIEVVINSKIIRLATPSVLDSLFNQLCPGYSKEPHATLDHIRQMYEDTEATQSSLLSTIITPRSLLPPPLFMDQETLPVSICQAFIDGLDSRLTPGFRTHFPDYSKSQDCNAIHQCKVREEMHQAALRTKSEYNNIRAIASKVNGFGGQGFSAQANTS
jgi:hypothetical protein